MALSFGYHRTRCLSLHGDAMVCYHKSAGNKCIPSDMMVSEYHN